MMPAVIEVRTTEVRSRAKPAPAGYPISAAGSPCRALVPLRNGGEVGAGEGGDLGMEAGLLLLGADGGAAQPVEGGGGRRAPFGRGERAPHPLPLACRGDAPCFPRRELPAEGRLCP